MTSASSAGPRLVPADPTFLGAPSATDLSALDADYAVVGIPYGVPYDMRGVHSDAANAPAAVRARTQRFRGQAEHYDFDLDGTQFGDTGARLVDCGDLAGDPRDLAGNKERAVTALTRVVASGAVPLVLGGDDSVPPLLLRAFADAGPVNVLHVDAHLDFRDEVHGIPDGYSSPMRRIREMPWVDQMIQVGMRGVGSVRPADVRDARAAGNLIVPAEQLHAEGVDAVLRHVRAGERYVISMDVDGLDPSIAPAASAPLPGGIAFVQALQVFRGLCERARFAGIDVVEHFPSLDVNGITSVTVGRLLMVLMGASARVAAGSATEGRPG